MTGGRAAQAAQALTRQPEEDVLLPPSEKVLLMTLPDFPAKLAKDKANAKVKSLAKKI